MKNVQILATLPLPHQLPQVLNHQSLFKPQSITSLGVVNALGRGLRWRCEEFSAASSRDQLISARTPFSLQTSPRTCLLHDPLLRDMVEYKGRVNAYSQEVLRKESQIKELQGRIDTGDGCEYYCSFSKLILLISLFLPTLFLPLFWPHFHRSLPCLRVGLCRQ